MTTRMLIDARHPEETRVAVLKGNRIEEFDFESADKKQIKGNIYLAKVTRVEPSLQAAFVDFGGNRHGFLAFSEIHPDYYQIPREDREALLAAEAEAAEEEARLRDEEEERGDMPGEEYDADEDSAESLAEEFAEDGLEEIDTSDKDHVSTIEEGQLEGGEEDDDDGNGENGEEEADNARSGKRRGRGRRQGRGGRARTKEVDEARAKRMALRRRYKIQDVIQRRQVLLVQVVKEERGNKGAALTTYLSLAGRYTVLMPNSSHGGGISRKISSASDRKRLKTIVADLTLPKSMGLIVRTAGLQRTKTEIKRDFDYLARLWDEIREKTLSSSAPALIHSDSDLIKRAIRDIYNRDIDEVVVEGEEGYKSAKSFMKMLMPSHARRVKPYADPVPLFQRYGAEDQLKAMYDPVVQLKSGGYLVINPTEALVSIDINSGRSTKEHGIEQTALSTNLEAAREIARQLRLRDMAGLVVIDFIDMEHNSNTRKVEKAMKEALKNDRARIQVGRISGFGLMEMSRQRLRTGVLEATTRSCPHCDGSGLVRTASSAALSALRLIEDEAAKGKGTRITLSASTEATVYLLNAKRSELVEIEQRYGVEVEVVPEGEEEGAKMSIDSSGPRPTSAPKFEPIVDDFDDEDEDEIEDDAAENEDSEDGDQRKKRRRRRRGGRNRGKNRDQGDDNQEDSDDSSDGEGDASDTTVEHSDEDKPRKRRRRGGRGRRGGRDKREDTANDTSSDDAETDSTALEPVAEQVEADMPVVAGPEGAPETAEATAEAEKPKRTRRRAPAKKADTDAAAKQDDKADDAEKAEAPAKPKRTRRKKADTADEAKPETAENAEPTAEEKPKPKRTRRKKAETPAPVETAPEEAAQPAQTQSGEQPQQTAPSSTDEANAEGASDGSPRRGGWWQRTFGNQ